MDFDRSSTCSLTGTPVCKITNDLRLVCDCATGVSKCCDCKNELLWEMGPTGTPVPWHLVMMAVLCINFSRPPTAPLYFFFKFWFIVLGCTVPMLHILLPQDWRWCVRFFELGCRNCILTPFLPTLVQSQSGCSPLVLVPLHSMFPMFSVLDYFSFVGTPVPIHMYPVCSCVHFILYFH